MLRVAQRAATNANESGNVGVVAPEPLVGQVSARIAEPERLVGRQQRKA
jgi:hypothetical protein